MKIVLVKRPAELGRKYQRRPISRKTVELIKSTAKAHGILQPGLALENELLSGFNRAAAADELGIPMHVIVYPEGMTVAQIIEIQMAENLARGGMNFVEQADSLEIYMQATGIKEPTVAGKLIGLSPSVVSQVSDCMTIPEHLRIQLANAGFGYSVAAPFAKLPRDKQEELIGAVVSGEVSGAELKRMISKPRVTNIKIQTPESYADLVAQLTEQVNRVKALEKQGIPFNVLFKVL